MTDVPARALGHTRVSAAGGLGFQWLWVSSRSTTQTRLFCKLYDVLLLAHDISQEHTFSPHRKGGTVVKVYRRPC